MATTPLKFSHQPVRHHLSLRRTPTKIPSLDFCENMLHSKIAGYRVECGEESGR